MEYYKVIIVTMKKSCIIALQDAIDINEQNYETYDEALNAAFKENISHGFSNIYINDSQIYVKDDSYAQTIKNEIQTFSKKEKALYDQLNTDSLPLRDKHRLRGYTESDTNLEFASRFLFEKIARHASDIGIFKHVKLSKVKSCVDKNNLSAVWVKYNKSSDNSYVTFVQKKFA
jgi:hypothetical protein